MSNANQEEGAVSKLKLPRNNFDFLRFSLASLVIFSHSYPLALGNEEREPLMLLSRGQMTLGVFAVDCFFIISGFLILHSWIADPNAFSYLRKRIARIYPGFIVATIIGAFVITPLFSTESVAFSWRFLVRFGLDALRLGADVPSPAFQHNPISGPVNGSLWSIPFEFWCYIGVLVLGVLGALKRRMLIGILFLVTLSLAMMQASENATFHSSFVDVVFGYTPFWIRLLPYFLVGMVFRIWHEKIEYRLPPFLFSIIVLIAGCIIPSGLAAALPVAGAYTLFFLAFNRRLDLSRFGARGDFSYGIYLYSFPAMQVIAFCLPSIRSPIGLFAISWPISIILGVCSWKLVESRFVRRH